jgi:hypothetical protein
VEAVAHDRTAVAAEQRRRPIRRPVAANRRLAPAVCRRLREFASLIDGLDGLTTPAWQLPGAAGTLD